MQKIRRYHSLDALRAIMMSLGLILHSALSYSTVPHGEDWPFKDGSTGLFFDVLLLVIHLFRIPVFFLVSGFFGALLLERRGSRPMIKNRVRRILVPLVVGWLVLFPLTIIAFAFAQLGGVRASLPFIVRYVTSFDFLRHTQLIHLWFLFDLMIFYVCALLSVVLLRRLYQTRLRRILWMIDIERRWGQILSLLILATAISLYFTSSGILYYASTWSRPPLVLVGNGLFFTVGWLLYFKKSWMGMIQDRLRVFILGTTISLPTYVTMLYFFQESGYQKDGILHFSTILTGSVTIWMLVFGVVGAFMKFVDFPSRLLRYIADASYWMYLVHVPIVIVMAGYLYGYPLSPGVKFMIVFAAATLTSLVTYHVGVRFTFIGKWLNGKRYER